MINRPPGPDRELLAAPAAREGCPGLGPCGGAACELRAAPPEPAG